MKKVKVTITIEFENKADFEVRKLPSGTEALFIDDAGIQKIFRFDHSIYRLTCLDGPDDQGLFDEEWKLLECHSFDEFRFFQGFDPEITVDCLHETVSAEETGKK
ncbi:MAG TPA: hypothetical protein DHV36_02280 [Desulfobacteraceae bacterium]|nr:hypothetical protein [Desulfobacteraceae bacterium]|tara:strand:+ start:72 stop:386 length:315 start_codon:yes stop_codon:yes gene_type:complete